MNSYSADEASKIIGISKRAIQIRCKKDDVRKFNNKYLITDEIIEAWQLQTKQRNENETKDFAKLQNKIEDLKEQLENIKSLKNIELFKLDKIEDFDFVFNQRKGNLVFVPKDKVYAEYTSEEYSSFEQKLKEWETLQTKIEHQEQLFDAKLKSSKELAEHYQIQFEYQKNQSNKILEMHQKLIDTIEAQNKIAIQRNVIEARDKDIINKDWKPKK